MTKNQTKNKKPFRCNLGLLIGCIFSSLLVALGLSVIFYTYENQKQRALETTENIFELSSIHTEEKLSGLIHSVKSFVTVSSALQSLGAGGAEKMSILLPYFMQSFVTIPWMESFYVGYSDGSFYMIQAIRGNEKIQQATSAPDQAAYAMKIIPPDVAKNKQIQFSYFDSELTLLETREEAFDHYDPRKREWYNNAISENKIVITKPYLFFTTQQIGITMAHSLRQGAGVVGADSVLTAIARLLQNHKITPSTQIVLLDSQGQVILSADDADLAIFEESR